MKSTLRVSNKSPTFQRLLGLTYNDLLREEDSDNDEVIAILTSKLFWRKKYEKDYGGPVDPAIDWRREYESKYREESPKYKNYLTLPYMILRDVNDKILNDDTFWKEKYIRDFGDVSKRVNNWKKEYEATFDNKMVITAINRIRGYLLDDIATIRSLIYNKYYRSLSREIRQLGHDLGGCRIKSFDSRIMSEESTLSQAWLLDNDDDSVRKNMMDKHLRKIFRHYYKLTSSAKSPTEYYGALYIGLIYKNSRYYFSYPEVEEDLRYDFGDEPASVIGHINELVDMNAKYIHIYIFMSPVGKEVSNWVIKSGDGKDEVGFKDIDNRELDKYLDNILRSNTIYPIISRTLPNKLHTTECGPWII